MNAGKTKTCFYRAVKTAKTQERNCAAEYAIIFDSEEYSTKKAMT